jgi:hypothetical protein
LIPFGVLIVPSPVDGANLARSIGLMATSTPSRRNTVRILFYGQSITANQQWPKMVVDDLQRRYPYANLVVENRAISGFAADFLRKTVDYDVPAFRPDLVILHDYGGAPDYEALVDRIARQTSAEIAIMDDFEPKKPPADPDSEEGRRYRWHDQHSAWLLKLCERYDLHFVDCRARWKEYVRQTNKTHWDLTTDGLHPNEDGNRLMAAVVAPQLAYSGPPRPSSLVRDLEADGKTRFEFEGNRVDLVPKPGATTPVRILIDGKAPSSFPGAYVFTRPSKAFGSWMPMILRFGSVTMPRPEAWKLVVTEVDESGEKFKFRLEGSVTGPDGEGASDSDFVSRSGRVTIAKEDWAVVYALRVSNRKMPVGFECSWRVEAMAIERYVPSAGGDSKLELAATVAFGLPSGRHMLELIPEREGDPSPIHLVRTFLPRRSK